MLNKMLKRLTDNYDTKPNSNIYRFFKVIGEELEELENYFNLIESYRDIDTAEGHTLDLIGYNVQEPRGNKDTELYRQFIITKIRANLSGGEIETLIEILQVFFGKEYFKSIEEAWNISDGLVYDGEPASLVITFFTTEVRIPYEAIDRVLAGGVSAFYYQEEVPRLLALKTSIEDRDIIFPLCGTFRAGEEFLV